MKAHIITFYDGDPDKKLTFTASPIIGWKRQFFIQRYRANHMAAALIKVMLIKDLTSKSSLRRTTDFRISNWHHDLFGT